MTQSLNIERPNVTLDVGEAATTIAVDNRQITLTVDSGGLVPISSDISLVAAANISALRAVTTDGSGQAVYASNDTLANAQVVGITTTSATTGGTVRVVMNGTITDSFWAWTKGTVYLGTNGNLTQTAPTGGAIVVHVGRALTATTLQIDVDTIITTV